MVTPFRIGFRTDADEVVIAGANPAMADDDERGLLPGGIVGFSLGFTQIDC